MLRFPRRGVARLAVGLAAFAVPFLGASAARGALGTSQTLSTANINRPVLTSVTAQGDTGLVSFCFATPGNQAVTSQGGYDPADFELRGYDEDYQLQAVAVEQESNQCVQVTFDEGQRTQYTMGEVFEDAVFAIVSGNPIGNEEDGAPLNGSESHNGTRGLSTGPDLQTVARPGSNRMAFIFDQNVSDNIEGCLTSSFWFYDQAGERHGDLVNGANTAPVIISVSDNVVVVQYSAVDGDAVADATIAVVQERASTEVNCSESLMSDTPDQNVGGGGVTTERQNMELSVAVPGSSGTTDEINLASAALVAGGESNQIAYTFDKGPVSINLEPACFTANLSNARHWFGDAATASGNVVTVTFDGGDGGFQLVSEMGVSASVQCEDAVESQTGQVGSTRGGKPVGGNVGAFGTGYTTGPEALGLSRSGGDMIVRVDQRVDGDSGEIELCDIRLINSQGAPYGPCPSSSSVTGNGSPTAIHRVTFSFDPVAAQSAAGLQILRNALESFDGDGNDFNDEDSVSQVFGFGGLT